MTGRACAAPACLVAAAIAGCGGGGDIASTAPLAAQPLSKAEFVQQADQICISTETRLEAAGDEFATAKHKPSAKRVAPIAKGIVIPALQTEVEAVRALGKPASGEAQLNRILALAEKGIGQIKADPGALRNGPPSALAEANRIATRFGAEHCGIRR
jgi:hypothetical protein